MRGKKTADGRKRFRSRFHHIVAGCTVDMHIEKRRSQRRTGKVQDGGLAGQLAVPAA